MFEVFKKTSKSKKIKGYNEIYLNVIFFCLNHHVFYNDVLFLMFYYELFQSTIPNMILLSF